MSGFQITITDAGRAALINAQNNGTTAFVLSEIGVSTQHIGVGLAGLTVLPNERKRLATMAGDVVADDTLHVTIRDEGVLFAVYSQPEPILEKSSAAMLLLAVDAKLVALDTGMVEFGPVGFTIPPASETVAGVVELATDAEVDAGFDPWRVITVRTLKRALGALSDFALKVHQHDAADTTSGVFNVGRIPALGMEKITGLATALAGKAALVHDHAMNQITGLVDALAGKAALVHQHAAEDIVSGVLAVGRIPALGMEKITGLAVALAGKADLAGAIFNGALGIARRGANAVFTLDADAGRVRQVIWQTLGVARWILQADETAESGNNAGSDLVLMNRTDAGAYLSVALRVKRDTGEFQFGRRPSFANGATPWDSLNLNPDSFAASVHTHDGLLIRQTYAPGTNLDTITTSGIVGVHANPAANLNFPVIATGALEVFASAATRVYQRYTTSSTTAPDIYERTLAGTTWSPWRKVVMDDLASTYAARGLIEMATDAEAITGTDQERAINPYVFKRRLDARAASSAETGAGAATDKFVTPSSLWSFARSIGLNGYAQVPGTPLVIQWGRQTGSMTEGQRTVLLPIAFGGGCVAMLANPWNSSPTADYYMQIVGRYLDRLIFMLNSASGSSGSAQGFDWLAVGFATGTPDPAYSTGGGSGGGGGGGPGGETNPEI
jgi:hypothetical protein